MKTDTIYSFRNDSIQQLVEKLEAKGFYLRVEGSKSKAPTTHHKTRQAQRRARALARYSPEMRRAAERKEWRRVQGTLKGKWYHLKRAHTKKGYSMMSFEEWRHFWREAGTIVLGDGSELLAWKARGRGMGWLESTDVVQLRRWDLSKGWDLENTYAQWKGNVLCDGYNVSKKINDLENSLKIVEEKA